VKDFKGVADLPIKSKFYEAANRPAISLTVRQGLSGKIREATLLLNVGGEYAQLEVDGQYGALHLFFENEVLMEGLLNCIKAKDVSDESGMLKFARTIVAMADALQEPGVVIRELPGD